MRAPCVPETAGRSGSGFIVSPAGHVVTNNHVAGPCTTLSAHPGGRSATLLARDRAHDLALLKLDAPTRAWLPLRPTALAPGDDVVAVGFPFGGALGSDTGGPMGSDGASMTRGVAGPPLAVWNMRFTSTVWPGNSGGPLLDMHGLVGGVVMARTQDRRNNGGPPTGIAVSGAELARFLRDNGVPLAAAQTPSRFVTDWPAYVRANVIRLHCSE